MGNSCCQDQNVRKDISEAIDARISLKSYSEEFYETDFPQDALLLKLIDNIKHNETFAIVLENHHLMKHKFLDKYYLGNWNAHGEPEGLGLMFEPDNYLYHGEFRVTPNGTGTLQLLKEGLIYQGQMREGRAEGEGRLHSTDGRVQFEGTMQNSFPKTGELRINNLADPTKSFTVQLEDFPERPCKILYGDGRTYEGMVSKRSFAPLGKGTAYFPDSSYYEGEWEEGEMHGHGYFRWQDGTTYNGEYQHGRKHGQGTFTYLSKKYYEGQWANGKQNGRGKLCDSTGKTLKEGLWKDGVFEREES